MTNKSDAYLAAEMSQAWTHYRHLEETRTKYLSFFATVVLTSSGFVVTLMKDYSKFNEEQFTASMSLFVFFLFVFSYFVWATIARIGFVLAAYEVVMTSTRKFAYGEGSSEMELWNIRAKIPPEVSRGLFRIQSAATYMVLGVCMMLLCGEAYMSQLILRRIVALPEWSGYLILAGTGAMLVLLIHGLSSIHKARRFVIPNSQLCTIVLCGLNELNSISNAQPSVPADQPRQRGPGR